VSQACPLFLVFPGTSSTPLSPPLVLEVGIVPQVPTASTSPHTWTLKWVHKELGSVTPSLPSYTFDLHDLLFPVYIVVSLVIMHA